MTAFMTNFVEMGLLNDMKNGKRIDCSKIVVFTVILILSSSWLAQKNYFNKQFCAHRQI